MADDKPGAEWALWAGDEAAHPDKLKRMQLAGLLTEHERLGLELAALPRNERALRIAQELLKAAAEGYARGQREALAFKFEQCWKAAQAVADDARGTFMREMPLGAPAGYIRHSCAQEAADAVLSCGIESEADVAARRKGGRG